MYRASENSGLSTTEDCLERKFDEEFADLTEKFANTIGSGGEDWVDAKLGAQEVGRGVGDCGGYEVVEYGGQHQRRRAEVRRERTDIVGCRAFGIRNRSEDES